MTHLILFLLERALRKSNNYCSINNGCEEETTEIDDNGKGQVIQSYLPSSDNRVCDRKAAPTSISSGGEREREVVRRIVRRK